MADFIDKTQSNLIDRIKKYQIYILSLIQLMEQQNKISKNQQAYKNNLSDIIFIRHAQSTFNQLKTQAVQKLGLQGNWEDYLKHPQFKKLVPFNPHHMDSSLTPKGRNQCIQLNKQCRKLNDTSQHGKIFNIGAIIVSPYNRALETCSLVFQSCSAPVIVEPMIGQFFGFSCDIHGNLEQKKKKYPNYDFTIADNLGEYYDLQILPLEEKNKIIKAYNQKKAVNLEQKQKVLLGLLQNDQVKESYHMMIQRAQKIKKILKKYREKYGRLAIVTHGYAIQFIKAKQFKQNGEPIKFIGIQNCLPYYQMLDEL